MVSGIRPYTNILVANGRQSIRHTIVRTATGMAKTTCALTHTTLRIRGDVEDHVFRTRRIASDTANTHQVIQLQVVAHAPRDAVIRARGVAAHTDRAHDLLAAVIQTQSAAEHVYTANALAHHWIGLHSERSCRSHVS